MKCDPVWKIDKTLDIQGLAPPRSRAVIETTMTDLDRGQTLRILTRNRETRESIPSLCASLGYELLELGADHGIFLITIRK